MGQWWDVFLGNPPAARVENGPIRDVGRERSVTLIYDVISSKFTRNPDVVVLLTNVIDVLPNVFSYKMTSDLLAYCLLKS